MVIAPLLIVTRTWKQPKYPAMEEWIKRRCGVYTTPPPTHTMDYHSAIKKKETMPFAATWMDLEITILSEVVRQKKTNII